MPDHSRPRARRLALALLITAAAALVAQDITLSTPTLRFVIDTDGVPRSLLHLEDGRECLDSQRALPFASVVVAGRSAPLNAVAESADGLELRFAGVDTVVTCAVEKADLWLGFTVRSIRGTRPERLTLLSLAPAITTTVGTRLCAAYDSRTAVGLMARNLFAQCVGRAGPKAILTASAQDAPGPRLEGAGVILIVCPTDRFKAVAQEASHALALLTNETATGTPVKDSDLVRGSYYFMGFGEKDIDTLIATCRQAGFRQVLLPSGAWCSSVGHYLINERNFPGGIESLQRSIARLHRAEILVGMHCFASKIGKRDSYVTPVPDRRFWRQFEAVLAEDVSATQTEIRVRGDLSLWPGSAQTAKAFWEGGVDKHRDVVIGDEIIRYEAIGPEGTWNTFLGCSRGAWSTGTAAHPAGASAAHYGVDGCIDGYIIDQETTLLDEAQDRLAAVFNTAGFDMVYFDGGEDVDRSRFDYYVANFQANAMRKFRRRPIIHMGTIMTHGLWHSFARSSTVDTYLNTLSGAILGGKPPEKWPTVRDHIDQSVRYMLSVRADMMPGELGWFGIWPRRTFHGQEVEGLQLDEIEYLMARSLAYDVPISIETDLRSLAAQPLAPGILAIIRAYEELRLVRQVPEAELVPLREKGLDVILLREGGGAPRFVPVTPLATVGGSRDVRATVGALGQGAVASLWHAVKWGTVTVDLPAADLRLVDLDGKEAPVEVVAGKPVLRLTGRRLALVCPHTPPAALRAALAEAVVWTQPPEIIVLQAAAATRRVGQIALGSALGVTEPEAFGDVLVGTAAADFSRSNEWYAEFTVDIPHDGEWSLWARQRYPSGTDQSFAIVSVGEPVTFAQNQVLGNCGRNEAKWHWAGRGSGSTTAPPGERIALTLKKGPFTFRIHPRECGSTPATNPRLDLILLTDDRLVVPSDALARQALGGK
jgi:hypothetical protein